MDPSTVVTMGVHASTHRRDPATTSSSKVGRRLDGATNRARKATSRTSTARHRHPQEQCPTHPGRRRSAAERLQPQRRHVPPRQRHRQGRRARRPPGHRRPVGRHHPRARPADLEELRPHRQAVARARRITAAATWPAHVVPARRLSSGGVAVGRLRTTGITVSGAGDGLPSHTDISRARLPPMILALSASLSPLSASR